MPRSSKATVTKRINRYGNYLTIVFIVEDPVYLFDPFMRRGDVGQRSGPDGFTVRLRAR